MEESLANQSFQVCFIIFIYNTHDGLFSFLSHHLSQTKPAHYAHCITHTEPNPVRKRTALGYITPSMDNVTQDIQSRGIYITIFKMVYLSQR